PGPGAGAEGRLAVSDPHPPRRHRPAGGRVGARRTTGSPGPSPVPPRPRRPGAGPHPAGAGRRAHPDHAPQGGLVTPERLLELLLRPVPANRAAWKDALRAELAGVGDRRERWAFALSCWRLPLRYALTGPRGAGLLVLAVLAAAEVFDQRVNRDG